MVPGLDRERPGAAEAVDIVAAIEFYLQPSGRIQMQIQRVVHFIPYYFWHNG